MFLSSDAFQLIYADSESDSESSPSSDSDYEDGGASAANGVSCSPIQPDPYELHPDDEAQDRQADGGCGPDESDGDRVSDESDVDPEYAGGEGQYHTMSSHLSKLDSLTARGCADKFFNVHTARWAPSMPRPGDFLHSAQAGGVSARETRKRRASEITRSAAESHAFCSSANLSQSRSDDVLDTFANVSTFMCAV